MGPPSPSTCPMCHSGRATRHTPPYASPGCSALVPRAGQSIFGAEITTRPGKLSWDVSVLGDQRCLEIQSSLLPPDLRGTGEPMKGRQAACLESPVHGFRSLSQKSLLDCEEGPSLLSTPSFPCSQLSGLAMLLQPGEESRFGAQDAESTGEGLTRGGLDPPLPALLAIPSTCLCPLQTHHARSLEPTTPTASDPLFLRFSRPALCPLPPL